MPKERTTEDASMKKMIKTNCSKKIAVSGAGSLRISVLAFPRIRRTTNEIDATVEPDLTLARFPDTPTVMTMRVNRPPDPRNTSEG